MVRANVVYEVLSQPWAVVKPGTMETEMEMNDRCRTVAIEGTGQAPVSGSKAWYK